MIAKGNLHAHGIKLASYLTTSSEDERAELVELRGFAATNIRDAFIDVQMQAAATRAAKPFFHAYVRAPEGETLTPAQWRSFADRLENDLGFAGQPRAVAFHVGADGERHMHIAWSRIRLDSLTVIDPGLYKNKMKQLCRAFEQEHGLTPVTNERGEDVKTKSANRAEFEESRRLGTDLKAIRNTIHEYWQSADNGQAFVAALADKGFVLARGDQRPLVVIDRQGGQHALSKRITGATAAVTRQKLADLDRSKLPSVAEGRAAQIARHGADKQPAKAAARIAPQKGKETVRVIGCVVVGASRATRPAGKLVKAAGKLADSVANAFEGLLGGGPSQAKGSTPADEKIPLDRGKAGPHVEIDDAVQQDIEQKSQRRQRYLKDFSREVPAETERDADMEKDRNGRERTRGE